MSEPTGPEPWLSLANAVPPLIWALIASLGGLVAVSWVTVWTLYHKFVMRIRSDVDRFETRHDSEIYNVYRHTENVEQKLFDRLDRQAAQQARQTELLGHRLDEINQNLIAIASNTQPHPSERHDDDIRD